MPTFVVLGKLTDQGAKDTASYAEQIGRDMRQNADKLGMKTISWYMTQGRYDFVVVVEAPDDETMLKQNLFAASRGRSRSETMRAYTIEEVQQIAKSVQS